MKKRKILIFHPSLAPYRVDFFNILNSFFDASFYFNLKDVREQTFNQLELRKKTSFKCNYLLNGFEVFGRSIRFGIISIIKKEKPEIILCSEYGFVSCVVFLYKIIFRRKIKLYVISDDSVENSQTRMWLSAFLRNQISKNIDGVIFTSREVGDWYYTNISNKTKILELPIIHDDDLFRNELAKSIPIANENIADYNFKGKKIILYVGRLVEVKNIPFLINVVSQLKSNDWVLTIVGDGSLMVDLKKQVDDRNISDKVYFIGKKEGLELMSWYVTAQVFILPSTREPYGVVVNEALLAGCKVLCSKSAGASALIDNVGELFDPYNEEELLNRIENSLTQIYPLSEDINQLRESKMPFMFKDKIFTLVNSL